MHPKTLGLIAGQGRLPFLVADGARAANIRVVCVALRDQAQPLLAEHVDSFHWVPLARPGRWIKKLRRENVRAAVMVGRVKKSRIYTPWRILRYRPDWRALRLWYSRLRSKDKSNETLLAALADELASGGIVLENSVQYCPDHLARSGLMTDTTASKAVLRDIEFGWTIARRIAGLDIGQAIAVKEQQVIAVEAIEGTDRMIERAGALCPSGGWTLIKLAKPAQDMRFDVPTVGCETIENLKKHKAACLAVEAERTLILDLPQTVRLADRHRIPILGRSYC